MKVRMIGQYPDENENISLEEKINAFIKDKTVVDIKYIAHPRFRPTIIASILYDEREIPLNPNERGGATK